MMKSNWRSTESHRRDPSLSLLSEWKTNESLCLIRRRISLGNRAGWMLCKHNSFKSLPFFSINPPFFPRKERFSFTKEDNLSVNGTSTFPCVWRDLLFRPKRKMKSVHACQKFKESEKWNRANGRRVTMNQQENITAGRKVQSTRTPARSPLHESENLQFAL